MDPLVHGRRDNCNPRWLRTTWSNHQWISSCDKKRVTVLKAREMPLWGTTSGLLGVYNWPRDHLHWSKQEAQPGRMAKRAEVCQGSSQHPGSTRLPVSIYPKFRTHRTTTHSTTKEGNQIPMDPGLHQCSRHLDRLSHTTQFYRGWIPQNLLC